MICNRDPPIPNLTQACWLSESATGNRDNSESQVRPSLSSASAPAGGPVRGGVFRRRVRRRASGQLECQWFKIASIMPGQTVTRIYLRE